MRLFVLSLLFLVLPVSGALAWSPWTLDEAGVFFDLDEIEEVYVSGGTFIVWAQGDTLQVPPALAAEFQADMIRIASNANLPILRITPTRIVNFAVARWSRYQDPNVQIGWRDGRVEIISDPDQLAAMRARLPIRRLFTEGQ